MISFWRIFSLEITAFVRSAAFAILAAVCVAATWFVPTLVTGDGTAEGFRELAVRYAFGGVFALILMTLLASAAGTLARERAAKRLQLTLVRPVRPVVLVLAKNLALTALGAVVLALSAVVLLLRLGAAETCRHVIRPDLPSPQREALDMYEAYMRDPETPAAVRKASRSTVLRILAEKALDHYQTVPTNGVVSWIMPELSGLSGRTDLSVRLRFASQLGMRQDVRGVLRLGDAHTAVSNVTQAVVTIPLAGVGATDALSFANAGSSVLMLRPRKDVELLVPADAFGWNLLRAYVTLVSVLALVVAFGTLLSSGLGRPVALFVAFVTLLLGEMTPSVIEQYPDPLESRVGDRIGLALTRAAAAVTRPLSAFNPIEDLAKDICVERRDVVTAVAQDFVALPVVLAFLAALVLPRKEEGNA